MADQNVLPSWPTTNTDITDKGYIEYAAGVKPDRPDVSFIKYPQELGSPGPFSKWMLFEARSARHAGRRGNALPEANRTDETLASVQLYVPAEALNSTITAQYDTNDMGPFMGVLSEAIARQPELQSAFRALSTTTNDLVNLDFMKAASSTGDAIKKLWETGKGTLNTIGGGGVVGQAALAAVLKMADEKFGGNVTQATGFRPNPRTDVLFSHVNYRTHRMEFMLIPRDEDEARAIDKIIKFFQFYMLPTYSPQIGAENSIEGMLIGFPYEFEISFWGEDLTPAFHHFNKIGRSVLQSVSVDHAGGSQVAFFRTREGELFPAVTRLSLEFQEVRLLARDEASIVGSASGKGLIDRGNVGSFEDPGRNQLADIASNLSTDLESKDIRAFVPYGNPVPSASAYNTYAQMGEPGKQGSGLGKQAESARTASLFGAGKVG